MPDDGILGDIGETIGEAAGAVGGELKKFGKSAASQVTGGEQSPDSTKSGKAKAKTAKVASPDSAKGELKKFGAAILGQVTGHGQNEQIAQMAKSDEEFSKKESDLIAQKIHQMYDQYAARRAREQKQEQAVEEQQKEQISVFEKQKKKQQDLSANPAIAKTRAEIKNYGAE